MRLVSYQAGRAAHYGVLRGDGIADLTGFGGHATLGSLMRAGVLPALLAAAASARVTHGLDGVALLPPVPDPQKCFCVGVNYAERNEEYRDNSAAPAYPSLFLRVPGSFVGHGQAIERPRVSAQFDYEGEIVLVIGKPGRHVAEADALGHVAGATLCNEGSVRDWLRHGKFNVTQGKNFDRSGSLGPALVTADELDLARPLTLTTRVNGEIRQQDSTARLMFPFARLIAYITTFTTLLPGDLIVTGTPTGAGARFDPPRWLVPGDVVEVSVPEIGVLANTVRDEA
jgi:2-keto-4-pentenoate hydratase/2-oxohepta-3-ene-1,7-dioic acid hydratase in catechol pathway